MFETLEARDAYRRGAHACYSSSIPYVQARTERALAEWLEELDAWETGDPPLPPHEWDAANDE
jgi:hypothetical protein